MQRVLAFRVMTLASVVLASACHRAAQPGNATAAAPVANSTAGGVPTGPCRVAVPDVDVSDWEEITEKDFVFCIPPGGRLQADNWRSPSTRLMWGKSPAGYKANDPTFFERENASAGPRGKTIRRSLRENIGGQLARIVFEQDDRYSTGWASWSSASIWMKAESEAPNSEALHHAIFRTVRFINDAK
jgi:hypothetical protein